MIAKLLVAATFLVAAGCNSKSNDTSSKGSSANPPSASASPSGPDCDKDFDQGKFPDKFKACQDCEKQHRGMGTMELDCKNAIAKPWK